MLPDTRLSIHDSLFSKLIAPKNYQAVASIIISKAKHSFFPWSFSKSSGKLIFSRGYPSGTTDSRIHRFRYVLQQGPYNLSSPSYFNKHGFNLGRNWCKKKVFGRNSFSSSKNHHHKLILTKLASCKNSFLRIFCSKKLESYQTPNILSKLNSNYLVPSPSAAIGISSTLKRTPYLCLSLGAVRHYHNNTRLPLALKNYSNSARFFKHVYKHKMVYMIGLGLVTIFLIGRETIPYSRRKHFIIIPASKDKSLGDFLTRTRRENCVLPRDHPDSVRVRSITSQILQALQSDLKIKQMSGLEYNSKSIMSEVNEKKEVTVPWWRRTKFSTRHLEGLNWEVVVVDYRYTENAYVLPGGKIVVYKGLLRRCESDAQLATVIGHEVGHVVARHYAERFTKALWFIIGLMIILLGSAGSVPPPNPKGIEKLRELILNPCSRRNEKEADYIGLLLMASAGYDPREAPKVYEMLDPDDSKFKFISNLFSTHPSGKKRVAALSKPKVMEEAMTRFSKAIEAIRREEEECHEERL